MRWCISHGIRIMITTMIANDTTTLNIGRCPYTATMKDDIDDDEFALFSSSGKKSARQCNLSNE